MVKSSCSPAPSAYIEYCLSRLRQDGGRVTNARLAVIKILSVTTKPLSAREILAEIKSGPNSSSFDLVSVYRNLEVLLQKGLIHKVGDRGAYVPCFHSTCGVAIHLIATCGSCELTEELHVGSGVELELKRLMAEDLSLITMISTLKVEGKCRNCVK